MASTWEKIPQTHRTILFEQFTHPLDDSKNNLYDILSVYDPSTMSDEELSKDVEKYLEARSFDEFLDKFSPKVYEYVTGTADDTGIITVQYTIDPILARKFPNREIELTKHTYYEMLVNMYSQKGDSGLANIDFNDEKVREILTPKREINVLYDKRRQIPLLLEKYEERRKKNENPAPIAKRIKIIRQEAVQQMKAPTAIFSLGLADALQKIELIDKNIKLLGTSTGSDGKETPLLIGRIDFDENGRLKLIPVKTSAPDDEKKDSPRDPKGDNLRKLAAAMQNDLNQKAADSSDFTKALVISTYTGVDIQAVKPIEEMNLNDLVQYREDLVDRKNILEKAFKQMKEAFVKELSDLVQKVLSVKIFFDHATVKGTDSATLPKAGLIVTNCNAGRLIDDSVKTKFKNFMEHYGNVEYGDKKIWFAILPNVIDEDADDFSFDSGGNTDPYGDLGSGNEEIDDEKVSNDAVDLNAAKSLMKIMGDSKVMTFFNFAPTEETTFSSITPQTIQDIQDTFAEFKNEHAVYALPNFTIMKAGVVPLNDEPNAPKISVPAVYINAAYVAAGLVVAAQQTDFWLSKGFHDEEDFLTTNACVRIDLESNDVARKLLTKFNRERSIAWSKDVINALTKNRFGFAFDGDRKYDSKAGKFIDNTYILNARTLDRNEKGEYLPIFAVLMKDFADTYTRNYGPKFKASDADDFFNVADDWARQSDEYNPNIINLILRKGEQIEQVKSEFKIHLKSGEKFINVSFVAKVED